MLLLGARAVKLKLITAKCSARNTTEENRVNDPVLLTLNIKKHLCIAVFSVITSAFLINVPVI